MKRTTWAALPAALLVLASARPAASADSIAYVNKTDGNIYLSTPGRLAPVPGDDRPAATATSRRPTTAP